ncbi:MAG: alcohol dehydrogenase catalytic domain-containing protein [Phycisphaerales bacterium]|nr:alcohol dehydrogenase catalytic domain-containing protein [Phycisphaerales bacterium]
MRALRFDGKQPVLVHDAPELEPAPGEALIRPIRVGVCSTDLELCKGYMGFIGTLGHEFVGIVESVNGSDPRKLTGKRVVGGINVVCTKCDMCRAGLSTHCRNRTVLGIVGRDGCFADRFTLPETNLALVPDNVDDDTAVFTEPLAAALQIKHQLRIEGSPYITVLGDGRLGLLAAQVAAQLNASVRVIGKHADKLAMCEKWGIKHRLLSEVGLREDQDIVIDCTGSADGLTTALRMVRPRGTILLKTTVVSDAADGVDHQANLAHIVINEIDLVGSRCGSMSEAMESLTRCEVDVVSLISKRMRLDDGPAILSAATQPGVIKVLVDV